MRIEVKQVWRDGSQILAEVQGQEEPVVVTKRGRKDCTVVAVWSDHKMTLHRDKDSALAAKRKGSPVCVLGIQDHQTLPGQMTMDAAVEELDKATRPAIQWDDSEARDPRGRKIEVGHRVFVSERPGLDGCGTVSAFRGVVGRVCATAVRVYQFGTGGSHTIRPEFVTVQYGRIEAQDRFEQEMSELKYGVAGGRKFASSGGKPSELQQAMAAMRRRYANPSSAFNKTHRLILARVLECRKTGQSQPGYTVHQTEQGLGVGVSSRSELVRQHVQELEEMGVLTIDPLSKLCFPTDVLDETLSDPVASYLSTNQEGEDDMARKTNRKTSTKKSTARKAPARRSKVDFSKLKAEDFFRENTKGESVFKPGHDARYAGILKRVADGTAGTDEKRIAFLKGLTEHPKVAESEHFKHLLAAARKAKAA